MNTINKRSDPCHPLNIKELNTYLPKLSLVVNSTCKKVTFPRGTKKEKKRNFQIVQRIFQYFSTSSVYLSMKNFHDHDKP